MAHAVHIHGYGGPETLSWGGVEVGGPGPGEARIRQTAIGLNYIDTYHRTGLYPIELPSGLGLEAAGRIVALGRFSRRLLEQARPLLRERVGAVGRRGEEGGDPEGAARVEAGFAL